MDFFLLHKNTAPILELKKDRKRKQGYSVFPVIKGAKLFLYDVAKWNIICHEQLNVHICSINSLTNGENNTNEFFNDYSTIWIIFEKKKCYRTVTAYSFPFSNRKDLL